MTTCENKTTSALPDIDEMFKVAQGSMGVVLKKYCTDYNGGILFCRESGKLIDGAIIGRLSAARIFEYATLALQQSRTRFVQQSDEATRILIGEEPARHELCITVCFGERHMLTLAGVPEEVARAFCLSLGVFMKWTSYVEAMEEAKKFICAELFRDTCALVSNLWEDGPPIFTNNVALAS